MLEELNSRVVEPPGALEAEAGDRLQKVRGALPGGTGSGCGCGGPGDCAFVQTQNFIPQRVHFTGCKLHLNKPHI